MAKKSPTRKKVLKGAGSKSTGKKKTSSGNGASARSKRSTKKSGMKNKEYEKELFKLQLELVKLQEWVKHKGLKVVAIFEGRDAAGKGGVIKRINQHLNPRICRVVALPAPTERETTQWYFQRYAAHLPAAGEMVLFDRSWYNRANVEHVMGFCSEDEYQEFMRSCPEFERMLVRSGIVLIKYWFSVSDEEQERRFQSRLQEPHKRWKLSPMDLQSRAKWVDPALGSLPCCMRRRCARICAALSSRSAASRATTPVPQPTSTQRSPFGKDSQSMNTSPTA